MNDPRGPRVRVVSVGPVTYENGGNVEIVLSCGCSYFGNPGRFYRVGDYLHCFACKVKADCND